MKFVKTLTASSVFAASLMLAPAVSSADSVSADAATVKTVKAKKPAAGSKVKPSVKLTSSSTVTMDGVTYVQGKVKVKAVKGKKGQVIKLQRKAPGAKKWEVVESHKLKKSTFKLNTIVMGKPGTKIRATVKPKDKATKVSKVVTLRAIAAS